MCVCGAVLVQVRGRNLVVQVVSMLDSALHPGLPCVSSCRGHLDAVLQRHTGSLLALDHTAPC